MTVQKIQSVYLRTERMNDLHAFYETALGLAPTFRDGNKWSQFRVGNTNFALSAPEEAAPVEGAAVIVFEAEDMEAATHRITTGGGRLLASRDMGTHGTVATFADPDNNIFQVFAKSRAS